MNCISKVKTHLRATANHMIEVLISKGPAVLNAARSKRVAPAPETAPLSAPKIIEIRRNPLHGDWEILLEGRQSLTVRASRQRAIDDANEMLRKRGGGEIVVLSANGSGEVVERNWVLGPCLQGISPDAPSMWRNEWPQRQEEGWKLFATIPSCGIFDFKPSNGSSRALIDLLQALLGETRVASGLPVAEDDTPVGVSPAPCRTTSPKINIYVRCSDEHLPRLYDSFFSFCLAVPLGSGGERQLKSQRCCAAREKPRIRDIFQMRTYRSIERDLLR